MKISELIVRLQEIEAMHGDLRVFHPAEERGLHPLCQVLAKPVRAATLEDHLGKFAGSVTESDFNEEPGPWYGFGRHVEVRAGEKPSEIGLLLVGKRECQE